MTCHHIKSLRDASCLQVTRNNTRNDDIQILILHASVVKEGKMSEIGNGQVYLFGRGCVTQTSSKKLYLF